MIVNWKKPKAGLLVVPIVKDKQFLKYIQLLPGNNLVDDADWELAKVNLELKIEKGLLEEISEDGKKVSSLKDLSAKKAIEIIKGTWDLSTLRKWQEKEGRDEVRAVLHNQVDAVNTDSSKIKSEGDA
jgi:hypothetical protein